MDDNERDLEAELQAAVRGVAESLRPLAEQVTAFMAAFSRAGQAWLEQLAPPAR